MTWPDLVTYGAYVAQHDDQNRLVFDAGAGSGPFLAAKCRRRRLSGGLGWFDSGTKRALGL